MGEYATYSGQEIKIGTCESMYYLRADQVELVQPLRGSVDPIRDGRAGEIRFRFPFPDEDGIAPGQFEDYDRGVKIPGWTLPADWEGHYSVQFKAEPGYLLSTPCPESLGENLRMFEIGEDGEAKAEHPLKIHRNGWSGGATISQQRFYGGALVTVVACGSCGAAWRLETLENAAPVIEAFRSEAMREEWRRLSSDWDEAAGRWRDDSCEYGFEPVHGEKGRARLLEIARRIEAGYTDPPAIFASGEALHA